MTTTATKPVVLIAKTTNHRLTLVPEIGAEKDIQGRIIREHSPGVSLDFENHRATITDEIAKAAGYESAEALRDDLVSSYIAVERQERGPLTGWQASYNREYWIEGQAPDEPKPTVSEQMNAIATFAARQDLEGLGLVIAAEEETHNREPILLSAQTAIETVKAAQEAAQTANPKAPEGAEEGTQEGSDPPESVT